jgi:RimJ/RimL family protein N-acetyltransferase
LAPGWPHHDSLTGIGLALEADVDPGWLILRDGVVIGECAVKGGGPHDGEAEISYGLAGSERGKGLGSVAVAAFAAWLTARPDIRTVIADVHVDNVASRRVLEKAGFRQAGGGNGPSYQQDQQYLRYVLRR